MYCVWAGEQSSDLHDYNQDVYACLKVHKREKFFVSDFEFFTIL